MVDEDPSSPILPYERAARDPRGKIAKLKRRRPPHPRKHCQSADSAARYRTVASHVDDDRLLPVASEISLFGFIWHFKIGTTCSSQLAIQEDRSIFGVFPSTSPEAGGMKAKDVERGV